MKAIIDLTTGETKTVELSQAELEQQAKDKVAFEAEQAELAKTKYQRDRKAEYDKLNQFEMQFDDQRDGTTTWVDAINDIKARYPK